MPTNRVHNLAIKLIVIIFVVYAWGNLSIFSSLPEPKSDVSQLSSNTNQSQGGIEQQQDQQQQDQHPEHEQAGAVGQVLNISGGQVESKKEFESRQQQERIDQGLAKDGTNASANTGASASGNEEKDQDFPMDDGKFDQMEAEQDVNNNVDPFFQANTINYIPNETGRLVPKAVWPVKSTNREKDQWVTLPHPGDSAMSIDLPKFWSPPVHHNEQFTRPKAMQIGTCSQPDQFGNYQRGDECPLQQRTIFVAIASYRDWQCKHTVTSIFKRAKHPERIRVAVVDQIVDGDDICDEPISGTCESIPDQEICRYAAQIDNYRMDAPLAVGPVFARHIGHRQYRGEYYTMQSDAHVTFTQDWDVDIIEQQEATRDEMTVLTTYLTDIVGSIDKKTGKSLRDTRPIMCNTDYEGGPQGKHLRHLSQPERMPPSFLKMPQLEPWWAAGFSFARGHFTVNVPYDFYQPMIFQGEEMSIGIRGFTIGYDYYAPQRSVCFHHYASQNKDRMNVPHFWENSVKYEGTGRRAMRRLLGIVKMNPETDVSTWGHEEENIYGIGKVRTPEKFYETFGIDVVKKTTVREPKLCGFVEMGQMHREFIPMLRSDGMGIDYDKIHYKHTQRAQAGLREVGFT